MNYGSFILVFAGPFIALSLIYLLWAYTAFRWRERYPRYYQRVNNVNDWLPKGIALLAIVGFILYLFGVFERVA